MLTAFVIWRRFFCLPHFYKNTIFTSSLCHMEKKQLIEIICVIAGVSLVIKAVDYLQYFVSALFQLLGWVYYKKNTDT